MVRRVLIHDGKRFFLVIAVTVEGQTALIVILSVTGFLLLLIIVLIIIYLAKKKKKKERKHQIKAEQRKQAERIKAKQVKLIPMGTTAKKSNRISASRSPRGTSPRGGWMNNDGASPNSQRTQSSPAENDNRQLPSSSPVAVQQI